MAAPVVPVPTGGVPVPMMGVPVAQSVQDERLPGETNEEYIARLRSLLRVQSAEVGGPVPASGGDPAAMAEFERLLMATSRVTIRGRHMRGPCGVQPLGVQAPFVIAPGEAAYFDLIMLDGGSGRCEPLCSPSASASASRSRSPSP